jgi:hypothetical protein
MPSSCVVLEIVNLLKICTMMGAHSVITIIYSSFEFIRTQLLFITFLSPGVEFPTNFEEYIVSYFIHFRKNWFSVLITSY